MKNEIIKRNITQDKEFYWTECSGSIERLYEKHNGIKIPNEYAFDILQTPVTLLDDGYHYERVIKGETQKKVIYGFNNEETFNIVKKEFTEHINGCIKHILDCQINEDIETPSFGRWSKAQCSVAVVNFFVDLRWEDECYELSSESLKLLSDHVDYLKSVVDDGQQDEITALAIDNGENLLNYKIPCSGVISRPAASTSCRSFFITSAGIHLRSTLTVRTRLRLRTMSIGA